MARRRRHGAVLEPSCARAGSPKWLSWRSGSRLREGRMIDRWFSEIELPLTFEQFKTLPTNPAYKYEYFDAKAWLSPRPKSCHVLLNLEPSEEICPVEDRQ